MSNPSQQPPSGTGSAEGQGRTPAEAQIPECDPEEFDTAEEALTSIPIGVPVTSDEFRRMKEESRQPQPRAPQPRDANAAQAPEDPSED